MNIHHTTSRGQFTPLAKYRPVIILLALIAAGSVLSFGNAFWLDNSVTIAIYSLMALSVGIAYGQAGILSLATAAFASIGAYGTAIMSTRYGLPPLSGLLFAITVPTLLGYALARVIGRLSPLPLAIATFMLSDLVAIAIREGGDFTGGFIGISGIPRMAIVPNSQAMHFIAWIIVILVLLLYVNLMNSAVGRAVNTARHDPLRARADGVNVPQVISLTFAMSSAVAGIAGWLYAHHVTYMGPDSMPTQLSVSVILMAVVGGTRAYLGPVFGAALLLIIGLYMPAAETQGMIFGGILVLVLLAAPKGILGTDWKALLGRKPKGREPVPSTAARDAKHDAVSLEVNL
jgi:branched-chain amino acid transport system permease protein